MPIPLSWETPRCIRVCQDTNPMGERASFSTMASNGSQQISTAQVGFMYEKISDYKCETSFSIISYLCSILLFFFFNIFFSAIKRNVWCFFSSFFFLSYEKERNRSLWETHCYVIHSNRGLLWKHTDWKLIIPYDEA